MSVRVQYVCVMVALALALPVFSGALEEKTSKSDKPIAPRLTGLGKLHYPITTDSEDTQAFFNQGLRLTYAFNHAEAVRAFQEAARLDPKSAMPHWGEALALGPNINDPMPHERELQALAAIRKAQELGKGATEKERDFIKALAARYQDDPDADRGSIDQAYVEAMEKLYKKYPGDTEAGTLYAAALMNTMPWHYWTEDLKPRPGTEDIVRSLEAVLKKDPDHPGAHHYYIHIVEASSDPDRGVASAERLAQLMPGAGHLVHMPSHIYLRVGRYAEASDANVDAIVADEDYIAQCQAQGLYPIGYYPHNIHFLWASSTLEGRSEVALDAAIKTAAKVPVDMAKEVGALQSFLITPLFAQVRFGRWQDILTTPPPAAELDFSMGIWHYARGVAFSAKGQLERAEQELAALEKIAAQPELEDFMVNNATAAAILRVATRTLAGEMSHKAGSTEKAVKLLSEAVELQDALPYMEPPNWHYTVRQSLGAVLVDAGRFEEAEAVYRDDLEDFRDNGWALYGLLQALRGQGKIREADEVEARFEKAWSRADVTLTSSRF